LIILLLDVFLIGNRIAKCEYEIKVVKNLERIVAKICYYKLSELLKMNDQTYYQTGFVII